MKANNTFAALCFLIPVVLIVALVAAYFTDAIELYILVIGTVLVIALAVCLLLMTGVGVHAFFKKKDVVHYNSSMSLDDVVEVDREMEKK